MPRTTSRLAWAALSRAVLVAALLPGCAAAAPSQAAPYLVADLAPGTNGEASTDPSSFFVAADRLYFVANPYVTGGPSPLPTELWVSDGTAAGTRRLPDLCVDACQTGPLFVAALGRTVLFVETSSTGADQLWRSDGTMTGTFRLGPAPRRLRHDPGTFALFRGAVYFLAYAPRPGAAGSGPAEQLWRTDGSAGGTRLVADLGPGIYSQGVDALAATADSLYLLAPAPAPRNTRATLWVSDGTAPGTRPVSGQPPLDARLLTAAADRVFFVAAGALGINQLWVSDGTAAGTLTLTRVLYVEGFPGVSYGATGVGLKLGQGRVYFAADDGPHGLQLWASDGTIAGTRRLTSFPDDPGFSPPEEIGGHLVFLSGSYGGTDEIPWALDLESLKSLTPLCARSCSDIQYASLVKVGDRVLFMPGDGWAGFELWSSDGTEQGTHPLAEVCAGAPPEPSGQGPCAGAGGIAVAGGAAYFAGLDGDLWRSDGTHAGTGRYADRSVGLLQVAALPDLLVFAGADQGSAFDQELFATDGTAAGTRQLTERSGAASSWPSDFMGVNGELYFLAGYQLWRSDGTAAGTTRVTDIEMAGSPWVTAAAGQVFFLPPIAAGESDLYVTDGTPAGTRVVQRFEDPYVIASRLFAAPGKVYFVVEQFLVQQSLWQSDGTAAGTFKVFDLPAPILDLTDLNVAGSDFYFTNDAESGGGQSVWHSDGTAAGTVQLAGFSGPQITYFSFDPRFTRLGNRIFFIEYGAGPTYLRESDGTPAGTVRVLAAGAPIVDPTELVAVGDVLYFFADTPADDGGRGLWRTDGTPAGTFMIAAFQGSGAEAGAPAGEAPHDLTPFGPGVAFAADDGVHGPELWVSDGSAAGTHLVADILPGADGSHPSSLAVAAGSLFFAANDGEHGFELWRSDGTAAGTRMVADIAPGPASASPAGMTQVGNRLYFSADDGRTGTELWALPVPAP